MKQEISRTINQKGFASAILLVLSLMVVAALSSVGTYLFLQSKKTNVSTVVPAPSIASAPNAIQDKTADWETYTNSNLNFSLKLPPNTEIAELENGSSFSVDSLKANANADPGTQLSKLFVKIVRLDTQKTFQENIFNYIEGLKLIEEGDFKYKQEDTIINGLKAVKLSYLSSVVNQNVEDYFFNQNSKTFHVSHSLKTGLGKQEQEKYKNTFNQILSTFKFLDQNQSDSISDWKTYVNTKFKYSIKFPQSWRTQIVADGAGNLEAGPDSIMVDIFEIENQDKYPIRYISVEPSEGSGKSSAHQTF